MYPLYMIITWIVISFVLIHFRDESGQSALAQRSGSGATASQRPRSRTRRPGSQRRRSANQRQRSGNQARRGGTQRGRTGGRRGGRTDRGRGRGRGRDGRTTRRSGAGGRRGRGGSRDQVEEQEMEMKDTRMKCYMCSAEFAATILDPNDLCYDPYSNETKSAQQFLVSCPQMTKFCLVQITTVNEVFVKVTRGCGETFCSESCTITGFGLDIKVCGNCCPESGSRSKLAAMNGTTTGDPDEEYDLVGDGSAETTTVSTLEIARRERLEEMLKNPNCA